MRANFENDFNEPEIQTAIQTIKIVKSQTLMKYILNYLNIIDPINFPKYEL